MKNSKMAGTLRFSFFVSNPFADLEQEIEYIGTVERRFIEIAAETYHAAVQRIFHTDVGM